MHSSAKYFASSCFVHPRDGIGVTYYNFLAIKIFKFLSVVVVGLGALILFRIIKLEIHSLVEASIRSNKVSACGKVKQF